MSEIVSVIGLGYVGAPLHVLLSNRFQTIGFDTDSKRVEQLASGYDRNRQITKEALQGIKGTLTDCTDALKVSTVYIITVPTPVDASNRIDLSYVLRACEIVAKVLAKGDLVIIESTVFPGTTDNILVPLLESKSGLCLDRDFDVGYSPERVNPGEGGKPLQDISKIVSGTSTKALTRCLDIYRSIIHEQVFAADSIVVAETAKLVENTQRDLNIAFMNELSVFFESLGVTSTSVLEAARTKWNFVDFRPGMVGGHCIPVDSHYMIHRAFELKIDMPLLKMARSVNEEVPARVAGKVLQELSRGGTDVSQTRVLLLGYTFKENCPDTRNTGAKKMIEILLTGKTSIDVFDPWLNEDQFIESPNLQFIPELPSPPSLYNAVLVSVGHNEFTHISEDRLRKIMTEDALLFDLKGIYAFSDWSL